MNARTYTWITHFCVAVAVLSAIMFDIAAGSKWAILAFGITAAIIAAVVYFYNSWQPDTTADTAIETSESPELSLAKIEWHYPFAMSERQLLARMLAPGEGEYNYWVRAGVERQLTYQFLMSKAQREEFGNRIAQALTSLYSPEPRREIEMECVVTRHGSFVFIVRPVVNKPKRPRVLQEVYVPTAGVTDSGEWRIGRKLSNGIPVSTYSTSEVHEAIF
jgi:hypothetical protein